MILLSFVLPLALWSAVSYLPFIWHPMMEIESAGDSVYLEEGQYVLKEVYEQENNRLKESGGADLSGRPVNPVYLPPPQRVLTAVYTAF